jgi:hypothetical protein
MILTVLICATAMLSFTVANLRLLLIAAAAPDEPEAAPMPRR